MPTCGGLRMGVESIEPKVPPLVMVKVPPCRSSRVSLPSRARASSRWPLDLGEAHAVGVAHDGDHQPLLGAHGDADVVVVLEDDLVALDLGVERRELP
jgi:hypothetical protein